MAISKQYQAYLNSPRWKTKRLRVLQRDKFLCQKCKRRRASQVHHKSYMNIFNEPLSDLISVCRSCHKKIHGIGQRRIFGGLGRVLAKLI